MTPRHRPHPIAKLQRWLDLVIFLLGRPHPVPIDEILRSVGYVKDEADERDLESARRMFERDKEELRAMGIPIRFDRQAIHFGREIVEGYRIDDREAYLPYLRALEHMATSGSPKDRGASLPEARLTLNDVREAVLALQDLATNPTHPFAAEALRVLRKMAFDVDLDRWAGAPAAVVDTEASTTRSTLLKLAHALRERQTVSFRYHGAARGQTTQRRVQPYGLGYRHGQWYLVGWDPDRDAIRTFHVGRMAHLRLIGPARAFTIPPGFRVADYLRRHPWELGDGPPRQVDVLFPP
jgi:proteasome accessory factor B